MEERGLTQQQVADAAGVSRAAVAKWLQGTIPGAGEVFKIARAFKTTMEWFFESIPYDASSPDAIKFLPPAQVPADQVPPALRNLYAALFELTSTPEGHETIRRAFGAAAQAMSAATQRGTSKESSTLVLTNVVLKDNISAMQDEMQKLIARLIRATAARNQKAALAKWLGVSLSSVSTWLAGRKAPSGKTTLRLLQWVEQHEAQQKQSPDSALTPAGLTQKKKHHAKQSSESKPPKP